MKTTLTWRSGGQTQEHTVTKGENDPEETDEEFLERSLQEFQEQLVLFPPD